jgi:hypothetical protein
MTVLLEDKAGSLTSSRLIDTEESHATRRLRKSDWWYLKSSASRADESTDVAEDEQLSSTQIDKSDKTVRPVRKNSVGITLDGDRKVLLQQWECVVLQCKKDVVCCELHDLTNESNPLEYAEVLLDEFNDYDVPLLLEGAVFYWSIGHLRRVNGQVKRFSEIRLRRMPKISKAQQNVIARKVKQLSGILLGK